MVKMGVFCNRSLCLLADVIQMIKIKSAYKKQIVRDVASRSIAAKQKLHIA